MNTAATVAAQNWAAHHERGFWWWVEAGEEWFWRDSDSAAGCFASLTGRHPCGGAHLHANEEERHSMKLPVIEVSPYEDPGLARRLLATPYQLVEVENSGS